MIKYNAPEVMRYRKDGDVGLDLYASEDITLKPGQSAKIPTETYIILPEGFGGFVVGRSGWTTETGLRVNTGTIDTNYRGDIKVMAENNARYTNTEKVLNKVKKLLGKDDYGSAKDVVIQKGDRVAQIVPFKAHTGEVKRVPREVIKGDKTTRGARGFGDSGKR